MSYLVLARKCRPQTFDQVVGQEPIVRTLRNAIKRNRVAHAMLFSGVRGVGKTTLARIMAKAINCENPDSPPCDTCSSCVEIRKGVSIDLHEIDGASNRGIQEIRELKENIRFQPAKSRYKIIIIDEVHMLTTEAFNALLKTLEEPPEHVFFMFATTELHKVPVTILSRCQRYELKRVGYDDLFDFFKKLAVTEQVEITDAAVAMIAREAGGSVRDGLSLLDQIFSFGGEAITENDVTQVLGLVDGQVFRKIAECLLKKNLADGLALLEDSYVQGIDLKRFSSDLLGYFRSLTVVKVSGPSRELLDMPDQEMSGLVEIAGQYSLETLLNAFQILLKGVEEMQYSSLPKMVLEMAFAKIIMAGDLVPVTTLLERLVSLSSDTHLPEDAGTGYPATVRQGDRVPGPRQQVPLQLQAGQKNATSAVSPPAEEKRQQAGPEEMTPAQKKDEKGPVLEPEVVSEAAVPTLAEEKEVRKHWDGFLEHVKDRKPWMAHALSVCASAREKDGELVLKYDDLSECKILQGKENSKLLNEYALDFFQKDLKIKIIAKNGTSLEGEDGSDQNLPQEERRALANDPLVQLTTQILDGQVSSIRTGPRSR